MKRYLVVLDFSDDPSTWRWLVALARSQKREGTPVTQAELLKQAAFCMADCAGRRSGSWEADVARSLLTSSGYASEAEGTQRELCLDADNAAHQKWRESQAAKGGAS